MDKILCFIRAQFNAAINMSSINEKKEEEPTKRIGEETCDEILDLAN